MTVPGAATVHRYPLDIVDEQELLLPQGAVLLHAARRENRGDHLELWAMVEPDRPLERRRIRIAGTGHSLGTTPLEYLGTAQIAGGQLVFHIFEMLDDPAEPDDLDVSRLPTP